MKGLAQNSSRAFAGRRLYTRIIIAFLPFKLGIGPNLRGVVGRKAGSAAGYGYSVALATSEIIWSPQNIDRFLSNPQEFVPGTQMTVTISDTNQRADIISFLT